jgi:hypothetical protein
MEEGCKAVGEMGLMVRDAVESYLGNCAQLGSSEKICGFGEAFT